MDINISIDLKDKHYGFSDLLDGRELNNQTKKEIIELIKEDIWYAFDQQVKVEAIDYTHGDEAICDCDNESWKEDEGGDWYCTIHHLNGLTY